MLCKIVSKCPRTWHCQRLDKLLVLDFGLNASSCPASFRVAGGGLQMSFACYGATVMAEDDGRFFIGHVNNVISVACCNSPANPFNSKSQLLSSLAHTAALLRPPHGLAPSRLGLHVQTSSPSPFPPFLRLALQPGEVRRMRTSRLECDAQAGLQIWRRSQHFR